MEAGWAFCNIGAYASHLQKQKLIEEHGFIEVLRAALFSPNSISNNLGLEAISSMLAAEPSSAYVKKFKTGGLMKEIRALTRSKSPDKTLAQEILGYFSSKKSKRRSLMDIEGRSPGDKEEVYNNELAAGNDSVWDEEVEVVIEHYSSDGEEKRAQY